MKNLLLLPLAAAVLSGCALHLAYRGPAPVYVYEPGETTSPSLTVSGLYYTSGFRDADGRAVVCDDRQTEIVYGFDYRGDLASWTSSLVGERTGDVRGTATFTLGDPAVRPFAGGLEVSYLVDPAQAPLDAPVARPQGIGPQSVVVGPRATLIGYTALRLTVRTSGGDHGTVTVPGIPVLDNCS